MVIEQNGGNPFTDELFAEYKVIVFVISQKKFSLL
jgi:hypothetical protein